MSKHTPGPWKYVHDDNRVSVVVGNGGRAIIHTHMEPDNPEAVADARLIAAAPDLLAALTEILAVDPRSPAGAVARAKARDLVASLEGYPE